MDLLAGMSLETLAILPWMAAAVFALAVGLWRPNRLHWTLLGAVLLFAAVSAGMGIYVLNHIGDPRWSPEGGAPLSVPSLSGTPVVGQYLEPLDAVLGGMAGGVNDFFAFQAALPVALNFFATSGWALLVSFPLAVIAAGVSFTMARRRVAEFARYKAAVDSLRAELDQVKLQISSGRSDGPAVP